MNEMLVEKFVFMKVGDHAAESWDDILKRKRREIAKVGYTLWGYGGTVCHPTQQILPFLRASISQGEEIPFLMQHISSNADPIIFPATHMSLNGVDWQPIPDGIEVTGSKYALVIKELTDKDLEVDLSRYKVAVGPSRGKSAGEYVVGRVDKGCFELEPVPDAGRPPKKVRITNAAVLTKPYAVMVRSER